ncbi:hypothetical protein HDU93_008879 [Gonapodya sp. JEL0774]|nr:hypothetical protein HDU93_008879 [Gonapodya sp. JEL0774]
MANTLDSSIGVSIQLIPSHSGGDTRNANANLVPRVILGYADAVGRGTVARADTKDLARSKDNERVAKLVPSPKNSRTNPLSLTEADVEHLSSIHVVDPYSDADLSWSDEAVRLKEMVLNEVEIRAREVALQLPTLPGARDGDPGRRKEKSRGAGSVQNGRTRLEHSLLLELRTLRLVEKGIRTVDVGTRSLEGLVELSLTGNEIDDDGVLGRTCVAEVTSTHSGGIEKTAQTATPPAPVGPSPRSTSPPKAIKSQPSKTSQQSSQKEASPTQSKPPFPASLEMLSLVANR